MLASSSKKPTWILCAQWFCEDLWTNRRNLLISTTGRIIIKEISLLYCVKQCWQFTISMTLHQHQHDITSNNNIVASRIITISIVINSRPSLMKIGCYLDWKSWRTSYRYMPRSVEQMVWRFGVDSRETCCPDLLYKSSGQMEISYFVQSKFDSAGNAKKLIILFAILE